LLTWSSLVVLAITVGQASDTGSLPTSLHAPQGLTAGGYDHFMGQLAPGKNEIYFAGNANSTIEMFVQDLERGAPRLLFDEQADINQPRISPDGTRLLYVSYRQDAGGDACIFELKTRKRRCLTKPGTAVLQVFWFPDSRSVGVVTRSRLDTDHQLRRIGVGGRGGADEIIVEQNMSAPAVSPDGRWLAYVRLERLERPEGDDQKARGSLSRTSRGFVLHRLDRDMEPMQFVPPLPGTSSFPAFAPDGSHLYFTQYLNDSNFDGVIDAKDNGVLFRVPFEEGGRDPIRAEAVQQLTSGRTNCQYPAPSADRLLATCVRAGHLQIYALPLDGAIPRAWSRARIEGEIAVSRDPWEQLLLLRQMLSIEQDATRRADLHLRMLMHHLAMREYESADDHLDRLALIAEQPSDLSPTRRRAIAGRVAAQREIIAHRRAEHRLGHAKLSRAFVDTEHARLQRLEALYESSDDSTRRLVQIARSEIELVLGDKAAALEIFDAIDITDETDKSVLQAWAHQAEALFRDLGDRARWLSIHETLADHPALSERERLHQALAFVNVLRRGRAPSKEQPLVEAARASTANGSALALMLDLEATLLRVPTIGEQAAQEELQRLWDSAPTFERHRAVAMTTIERAARHEWGRLLHVFGERWLADVPAGHPERKYAEALYAEVMLERAYVERRHGRIASARELFVRIIQSTGSLEAYVGYIEAALDEGRDADALRDEMRSRLSTDDSIRSFTQAYIVARGLSTVDDPRRHAAEIERARALLRPVAEALPRSPEVHHLYAYLAHRHFHRSGDKEAGMAAHTRYHLALDLAPDDPRRRANLLAELGLLQAALGNHHIALRHFSERERLPFADPRSELSFRLSRARSLFHTSAYPEAKTEVTAAMQLVEREPTLGRFLPLVLDKAALYHYAAGDHDAAVKLYTELVASTPDQSLAMRMKARLALGASALAAGDIDLARTSLLTAGAMLDASEKFRSSKRTRDSGSHFERDDYRTLAAGLLAATHRAAGDLPAATTALLQRRELHRSRRLERQRDGDLLELARISHQLAELAYRRGDTDAARRHIDEGIAAADTWRSRTDTEIDEVTLALVRAAAELHLYGGTPSSAFSFDVHTRLHDTYEVITKRPNPRWADERFLFSVYLTMIETKG
jgi:cellulose synthase operon protein C